MAAGLKSARKVIPIINVMPEATLHALYQSEQKIYPRKVSGYFNNWRWAMIWLTQLVFYGTPWLQWGERQAVLFNISSHQFFLFGLVLYPQDLIYLAFILIISALALFLFTAVAGRLWCGFACPQSVYTEIFLWIERQVEGDRLARMRLDNSPSSAVKVLKKTSKHVLWLTFSLWTGFTFLAYFTPIRELMQGILLFNLSAWETFWLCFYGLATYGNAGFLREQVCKYMCPYARFQSAMFDDDTLIVSYDKQRGEPRSGRAKSIDAKQTGLGDCVDCHICVQVCPVGIDIRDGLQYACISCGLCIDACDAVMDKMDYPKGLIRFSTQHAMNETVKPIKQTLLRPRVVIYAGLLLMLSALLVASLWMREPFKTSLVRDRGVMSRMTADGQIENVYLLQITNVTEQPERYHVAVSGLAGLSLASASEVTVAGTSDVWLPMTLKLADGQVQSGSHPIYVTVAANTSRVKRREQSMFYMP